MGADYGIAISPRLQHQPLWKLSSRAFRLWVFLAMKAQHAVFTRTMRDGQRVTVGPGQVLTSHRHLKGDAGYSSPGLVVADLAELQAAGVISPVRLVRERFKSSSASASESETHERFRNRSAAHTIGTLITVHGARHLREQSASESETKRERERNALSEKNANGNVQRRCWWRKGGRENGG